MPFTTLHLHPNLLKGIRELGFTRPTPVQAETIPAGMAGRDVLACAQTGSGKTAAFLLPILHRLMDKPRRTTRALILTPTRELAAQILEDFNALAVHTPLTGAAVYGGVGMGPQEHAFRAGVDLIVATPGRLLDHATRPYAKLGGLEYLVLDEADRMLDMGFLPDIKRILRHIPTKRQTLFFSATMPAPIGALAADMLKQPVTVNLQRRSAPAVGITQAAYPVPQHLKAALLVELLTRGILTQALVFTRTKHRANRLADHLVRSRINAERIHGNRSQSQRTLALAGFKSGEVPRAGGHRYRLARHRRRGVEPRRQLRRPEGARRLHPPRGAHRPRRADRRGLHLRRARRRGRLSRHRARHSPHAAARDAAGLRLWGRGAAAGDPAARAHRRDPRAARGRTAAGAQNGRSRSPRRHTAPGPRARPPAAAGRSGRAFRNP
jgi:hypothetical protein